MKVKVFGILFFLLGVFLTGCGKDSADKNITDVAVEREYFPNFEENFCRDGEEHSLYYMNMQFLGEVPVQFWAEKYEKKANDDHDSILIADIYLWSINGEQKLLLKEIDIEYVQQYKWFQDQEGCFYLISNLGVSDLVVKLDSQGKEIFKVENTDSVLWEPYAICQAPDEKIYLLISEGTKGYRLAELDSEKGAVTVLEEIDVDPSAVVSGTFFLGTGRNGPAVCRRSDIREVNTETGELTEVMLFGGTSYSVLGGGSGEDYERAETFFIRENGLIEILKADSDGSSAYIEKISQITVEKIPIVLCAPVVDSWLKRQIVRFNQENNTYHIIIEEFGESDGTREDEYESALEDYSRQISVQAATGKGPDILVGKEILNDNILEMIEKGVLEDLQPYMERTGIRKEDYFPLVFNAWNRGEEIYGICAEALIEVEEGRKDIIGENVRETVENLLAFQEKAAYRKRVDSREMLRIFLEGSDTLWGMVDWETGTCSFEEEFFKDLLTVSKKYGYTSGNQVPCIADDVSFYDLYWAAAPSELDERGMKLAGWMFDDGYHAKVIFGDPIAINSGSDQKEGAWEFLCFLLSDEAQEDADYFPLKRDILKKWESEQLKRISDVKNLYVSRTSLETGEWEEIKQYKEKDRKLIETEKLPYFEKMLEEARHLPLRSAPVVDIICEEAEDYFNGNKSAEEIIEVIENRVRLYLNE